MKARIITTAMLALFLASGCVSLNTPDGYAERESTGRYDYKAISTDASVISITVQRNEDKKKGTLPYWTEASRKHMTLSRGYEFKEEGEFTSPQGKGHWMLFSRKHRGTDYLYVLGLVVDGRKIYVLEAGGELEFFEKDVTKVVQAFGTLD